MSNSRWFKVPFVIGRHMTTEDGILIQDGCVGSLQTLLVSVSLGVSALLAADTVQSPHGRAPVFSNSVLAGYMLLACALLALLCRLRTSDVTVAPQSEPQPQTEGSKTSKSRRRLVGAGAGCCYLPVLLLQLLGLVVHADCLSSVHVCGAWKISEYMSAMACNVTHIAFVTCMLGLAVVVSGKVITRRPVLARHLLAYLAAATMLTLVFGVRHSPRPYSHHHPGLHNLSIEDCEPLQRRVLGDLNATVQCLTQKTPRFLTLHKVAPLVYPASVMYVIFILLALHHMFTQLETPTRAPSAGCYRPILVTFADLSESTAGEQAANEDNPGRPRGTLQVPGTREAARACPDEEVPLLQEEAYSTSLVCSPRSSRLSASTASDLLQDLPPMSLQSSLRDSGRKCLILGVLGALFVNVAVLAGLVLSYTHSSDAVFIYVNAGCKCWFMVTALACMARVLWVAEAAVSNFQPYSALELVLVVSSAAVYVDGFLTIIASVGQASAEDSNTHIGVAIVSVIQRLLEVVFTLVQTAFMLHTVRLKAPPSLPALVPRLRSCALLLALSAGCVWGVDGPGAAAHPARVDLIQTQYFGLEQWWAIFSALLPLELFYRLTSFILLLLLAATGAAG